MVFYYDMDLGERHLSDDDLAKLEQEMRKILAERNRTLVASEMTIAEAEKWAKSNGQPYKLELIEDFKNNGTTKAGAKGKKQSASTKMSFYTNGDFTDLCMGWSCQEYGRISQLTPLS